ncbi:MAG: glycosyltransferase [Gemmataceae bacterium]|nr:glycosyltransferase [Gemmataceae bacterium]
MKILLAAIGTSGDVDPFVGLGRAMKRRGHRVTLLANRYFERLVERAELEFAPWGDAEEYKTKLNDPDFWDAKRSIPFAFREMFLPAVRPLYQEIVARYEPGETIIAGPPMAIGARLAHDKLGVPLATVLLQPTFIRSVYLVPEGYRYLLPRWSPIFYRRLWIRFVDRWLDGQFGPQVNAVRAELGLPPVSSGFYEWFRSPQLQIGMFPDWFGTPQPDWPPSLRVTGFPLYDEGGVEAISPEAKEFLDAGSPPVVFTFGTGMRQAKEIFAESVAACRTLGRRGILLTRFKEQLPANLPDGIRHFDYLPFGELLPRVAALVHHGGIGTLAQALAAGIPQLVVPFAYDQPDNAARLERLGVARTVPHDTYAASLVAPALRELLDSPAVASQCRVLAQRLRDARPLEEVAQALEALPSFGPRATPRP